jgi:uncharacterized protein (DUF2235 family)
MPKNILIFSDGTGQAGGLRPDQCLSNVYKLYRATRIGPDSPIDPAQQVAFYDPGLGSADIGGPAWMRPITATKKFLSSAFGTGFTSNVADCYEHILRVYEPGDRIFLFGFSRGAYTARSVAGVLNLCGVPVKDAQGDPIPRWGRALRGIADEAVHTVYEHGAGRPREKFEDEREEQARRFRVKYGTEDDPKTNVRGNVVPYFIGVFDTVAALGSTGVKRVAMIAIAAVVAVGLLAAASGIVSATSGLNFWWVALGLAMVSAAAFVIYSIRHRVKTIRDFPNEGDVKRHWSAWRFAHYDRFLDRRVRYARHAQAIDERRSTFARVGWGRRADMKDAPDDWLVQKWFAGNHSDIGGSYAESESRLSDIALEWMAKEAEGVPNGSIIDWTKLHLFPDPAGFQHCEVAAVRDLYPSWVPAWARKTWHDAPRPDVAAASCHESVIARFKLPSVQNCDGYSAYKPESLVHDETLSGYYYSPATKIGGR